MTRRFKAGMIVIPQILLVLALIADETIYGPRSYCLEESAIVSVDEITYRGGWVTLANGQSRNVGQSGGRIGHLLCVEWGKRGFLKPTPQIKYQSES